MKKPSLKTISVFVLTILGSGVLQSVVAQRAVADIVPSYATTEQTIQGRIAGINGPYSISVRDDRGYLDSVSLHHGTVINPRGLTLAAGMQVTIYGYNGGSAFVANEIDTPYSSYYPQYYPRVRYGLYFGYPVYPYSYYGFGYYRFGHRPFGYRPFGYHRFGYGRSGWSRPGFGAYGRPHRGPK